MNAAAEPGHAGTAPAPLISLMGATASGKTDAAIALCERFPFEIISVDAALVYRGLDIGTAKPDPALRARYPHHLVDIRDPGAAYSAAEFCRDVERLSAEIRQRNRWPLLVGGTMFYFNALESGLAAMPQADPALRAQLANRAVSEGWPALYRELARRDPERAAAIDPNDSQRIQRALEICLLTGDAVPPRGARASAPAVRLAKIALAPPERAWLHRRIEVRFRQMLAEGLLDEVKNLINQSVPLDSVALRTVGYRQSIEYLQGKVSYNDLVLKGVAATRQLAKRQLTWLRNQTGITWFDCTREDLIEQLAVYIENLSQLHASAGQRA